MDTFSSYTLLKLNLPFFPPIYLSDFGLTSVDHERGTKGGNIAHNVLNYSLKRIHSFFGANWREKVK